MTRFLPNAPTATSALVMFTVGMVAIWVVTASIVPVVLWLIGMTAVLLRWLMGRPRQNVHIYGPGGKEWVVKASTAERRIRDGWSYQPLPPEL
ncbi:MAG TPA: hypothetical protein VFL75_06050 [Candidatus Limnocylindria bacterium]|jgi:hypothetical protein|nr:hypothetical protein [Candidatus Limnocylindria bacterium]